METIKTSMQVVVGLWVIGVVVGIAITGATITSIWLHSGLLKRAVKT